MTNRNEVLGIQKTITPGSVWAGVVALNLLVWAICAMVLQAPVWSMFLTLIALGIAIFSGMIAVDIVDWHGVLIFNPWAKSRRVLFSGLHVKLPWEKVEEDGDGNIVLTSLVRTISSKETKPHPTNDPAEVVETSLLIHIRVNSSGTPDEPLTPQEAADNFVRFRSIKEEALTEIVRVEIEKMFAEYYGSQEMEALLKPHVIQEAVLNLEGENGIKTNDAKIKEMEKKYGVSIGVVLESSRPDKATQDMKRTPAIAEALQTARHKLMEIGPKGEAPLTKDEAHRASLLLDPNSDYTERKIDIAIKGLENARDITVLGGLGDDSKKGGKK